jgi:hypothetical protein
MPSFLPTKYKTSHRFALELHDELVSIVVQGEANGIFAAECTLREPNHSKAIDGLCGVQLWEWLRSEGYSTVVEDLTYRQCIVGLLSDLCHYIFESLQCSRKGKTAVAFSLLRKPLKDNLFYLEWMLADRAGFLKAFAEGGDAIDVTRVSPERKVSVIRQALGRTGSAVWSPEFLYELRYDKSASFGLEAMWNKATHLITTCRSFTTDSNNFNFIFSNRDDMNGQWEQYYILLPILLLHAVDVACALEATIVAIDGDEASWQRFRRTLGFLLWADKRLGQNDKDLLAPVCAVANEVPLNCPNCESRFKLDRLNLRRLYRKDSLVCNACAATFDLRALKDEAEILGE